MEVSLEKVLAKMELDFPKNIVRYKYDLVDPDTFDTYFVLSINGSDYRVPISKQEIESSIKDNTFENVYKVIKQWRSQL